MFPEIKHTSPRAVKPARQADGANGFGGSTLA